MSKIKYIIMTGSNATNRIEMVKELTRAFSSVEDAKVVRQDSFDAPIRHLFAVMLGDKYQGMNRMAMRPELNGMSLAAGYDLVKYTMRRNFGDDCFGRWLIYRTLRNPHYLPKYVLIDDGVSAFDIEALPNRTVIELYNVEEGKRVLPPVAPNISFGMTRNISQVWQFAADVARQMRAEYV